MAIRLLRRKHWWSSLSQDWKSALRDNLELVDHSEEEILTQLAGLTDLDLSGTDITDLSPLLYLPQLEILDISHTHITEFTPIQSLQNLKGLHACFLPSFHLPLLNYLPELEILDISYPDQKVGNPPDLSHLSNLRELYLNSCGCTNVTAFVGCDQLEVLCLHYNQIPLEEIMALRELMQECKVMV
ncbi:MAG: leucine-rich repeat domain-containing protein [Bacteroidota bacterium]